MVLFCVISIFPTAIFELFCGIFRYLATVHTVRSAGRQYTSLALPPSTHTHSRVTDCCGPWNSPSSHVHKITNAPVFLMEREVMDFWREICITCASYRGGPWIRDFFGPTPITGPRNAYFPPEIHYFPLHKKHQCINSYTARCRSIELLLGVCKRVASIARNHLSLLQYL